MRSFKQFLTEGLKKGDRVVATKTTRGGYDEGEKGISTVKKGTKGTYQEHIHDHYGGSFHHIEWDGHKGKDSLGSRMYAHEPNEFKKVK